MMTQYLAERTSTQEIEYGIGTPDPEGFSGPIDLPPLAEPGTVLIAWQGVIPFGQALSETCKLKWDGAKPVWVEQAELDALRSRKIAEMSQACGDAITAGFISSALGAAHDYPAKPTDQANLSGSVLASILPGASADWSTPFWCADAAGAWDFRMHSAAQIQQVGVDAKAAILNCMTINQQLATQISTASAAQLAAIVWPA